MNTSFVLEENDKMLSSTSLAFDSSSSCVADNDRFKGIVVAIPDVVAPGRTEPAPP